jgi:hypothetical protein
VYIVILKSLPNKNRRLDLRAPSTDVTRWQAAAKAEKMTLSDWIRRACDAHVKAHAAKKSEKRARMRMINPPKMAPDEETRDRVYYLRGG